MPRVSRCISNSCCILRGKKGVVCRLHEGSYEAVSVRGVTCVCLRLTTGQHARHNGRSRLGLDAVFPGEMADVDLLLVDGIGFSSHWKDGCSPSRRQFTEHP